LWDQSRASSSLLTAIVEGAPGEPLCRDMTDFRRLSAAKRKLEDFEISKDASRLRLTGCASQTVWKT